jgi:hypothetical protein
MNKRKIKLTLLAAFSGICVFGQQPALQQYHIGVGDANNLLSGSSVFKYDNGTLTMGSAIDNYLSFQNGSGSGLLHYDANGNFTWWTPLNLSRKMRLTNSGQLKIGPWVSNGGDYGASYKLQVEGGGYFTGQLKAVLPNSGTGLEIAVSDNGNTSITGGYTGLRASANFDNSSGDVRLIDLENLNPNGGTPNANGYLFHSKAGLNGYPSYITLPQTGGLVIGKQKNNMSLTPYGGIQIPLYVTSPLNGEDNVWQGYFNIAPGVVGGLIENTARLNSTVIDPATKTGLRVLSTGTVHNANSKAVNYGVYVDAKEADINYCLYAANGNAYFKDNIGIGTDPSADYKLAVNGSAIFNKIKVKQYPWADYVFDPGYKLPTLKEVEAFIKEHRHLPDVASAKEVRENGIDLGESEVVLLKKIEELTLYMIEQDKKIARLEEQNKSLEEIKKELDLIKAKISR